MLLFTVYLRRKTVYLPTVAKVLTGGHQEIEPVSVVDVSDAKRVSQALKELFNRGNPVLERYSYAEHKEVAVLKCVGIKSYSAFVRQSKTWHVILDGGNYEILGQKRRQDRGWEPDPENEIILPEGASEDDLVERVVEVLQAAASG